MAVGEYFTEAILVPIGFNRKKNITFSHIKTKDILFLTFMEVLAACALFFNVLILKSRFFPSPPPHLPGQRYAGGGAASDHSPGGAGARCAGKRQKDEKITFFKITPWYSSIFVINFQMSGYCQWLRGEH